jgi:uncharacterized OsmC-like protein
MLEYKIDARVEKGGLARAIANQSQISFDATSGRDAILPNPAELLLTSVAACILKNVQRYSEILKIPYRSAKITVNGIRNENPPFMKEITYQLTVDTDVDEKKIANWHKNILKFGTISNTVAKATSFKGEMVQMQVQK